jgi:hypothetical protein
MQVRLLL